MVRKKEHYDYNKLDLEEYAKQKANELKKYENDKNPPIYVYHYIPRVLIDKVRKEGLKRGMDYRLMISEDLLDEIIRENDLSDKELDDLLYKYIEEYSKKKFEILKSENKGKTNDEIIQKVISELGYVSKTAFLLRVLTYDEGLDSPTLNARESVEHHLPIQENALFFFKEIVEIYEEKNPIFIKVRADTINCRGIEANMEYSEVIFDNYANAFDLNQDISEAVVEYYNSLRPLDAKKNDYLTEVLFHCDISPNIMEIVENVSIKRERTKRKRSLNFTPKLFNKMTITNLNDTQQSIEEIIIKDLPNKYIFTSVNDDSQIIDLLSYLKTLESQMYEYLQGIKEDKHYQQLFNTIEMKFSYFLEKYKMLEGTYFKKEPINIHKKNGKEILNEYSELKEVWNDIKDLADQKTLILVSKIGFSFNKDLILKEKIDGTITRKIKETGGRFGQAVKETASPTLSIYDPPKKTTSLKEIKRRLLENDENFINVINGYEMQLTSSLDCVLNKKDYLTSEMEGEKYITSMNFYISKVLQVHIALWKQPPKEKKKGSSILEKARPIEQKYTSRSIYDKSQKKRSEATHCANCGAEIMSKEQQFCEKCGAKLNIIFLLFTILEENLISGIATGARSSSSSKKAEEERKLREAQFKDLRKQYQEETGRLPIAYGKKTKEYKDWLNRKSRQQGMKFAEEEIEVTAKEIEVGKKRDVSEAKKREYELEKELEERKQQDIAEAKRREYELERKQQKKLQKSSEKEKKREFKTERKAQLKSQRVCEFCGAELREGAKFCSSCGSPISLQFLFNYTSSSSITITMDGKITFEINYAKKYISEKIFLDFKKPEAFEQKGVAISKSIESTNKGFVQNLKNILTS